MVRPDARGYRPHETPAVEKRESLQLLETEPGIDGSNFAPSLPNTTINSFR
jgi:hypothetical protein